MSGSALVVYLPLLRGKRKLVQRRELDDAERRQILQLTAKYHVRKISYCGHLSGLLFF